MKALWLWSLVLVAHPALACKCEMRLGVCAAVANSVVFTGTVESVAPKFLSRWNLSQKPELNRINQAHERYLNDKSPANLAAVKDAIRQALPDLVEEDRRKLDAAASEPSMATLFSSVLEHGRRVRFRVRTSFRDGDDDDDKADDAGKPKTLDVWTPSGDCGIDFQVGETYLVYASDDEETNIMEADSCTRTRRLSDAGPDLAYLAFYHDKENPAGRVEGFITFDSLYQVRRSVVHDPDGIESPAQGLTVELQGAGPVRYALSDSTGRYVFDGLPPGNYQVTVHPGDFPESRKVLSGPRRVRLEKNGCSSEVFWIPKDAH